MGCGSSNASAVAVEKQVSDVVDKLKPKLEKWKTDWVAENATKINNVNDWLETFIKEAEKGGAATEEEEKAILEKVKQAEEAKIDEAKQQSEAKLQSELTSSELDEAARKQVLDLHSVETTSMVEAMRKEQDRQLKELQERLRARRNAKQKETTAGAKEDPCPATMGLPHTYVDGKCSMCGELQAAPKAAPKAVPEAAAAAATTAAATTADPCPGTMGSPHTFVDGVCSICGVSVAGTPAAAAEKVAVAEVAVTEVAVAEAEAEESSEGRFKAKLTSMAGGYLEKFGDHVQGAKDRLQPYIDRLTQEWEKKTQECILSLHASLAAALAEAEQAEPATEEEEKALLARVRSKDDLQIEEVRGQLQAQMQTQMQTAESKALSQEDQDQVMAAHTAALEHMLFEMKQEEDRQIEELAQRLAARKKARDAAKKLEEAATPATEAAAAK